MRRLCSKLVVLVVLVSAATGFETWSVNVAANSAEVNSNHQIRDQVFGVEEGPPLEITPVLPTQTSPQARICGDADLTEDVTSVDAALVLQFSAALLDSLENYRNGDVDADGALTSLDALLILQHVAALLTNLTCAAEDFSNATLVVTVSSEPAASASGAVVGLRSYDVSSFGPEDIPLEVTIMDASRVAGFQFVLAYDDTLVEFVSFEGSDFLRSSPNGDQFLCDARPVLEGIYVVCVKLGPPVCLGGLEGATGNGTLATLNFRPLRLGEGHLNLTDVALVADDIDEPCDLDINDPISLPVTNTDANIAVTAR